MYICGGRDADDLIFGDLLSYDIQDKNGPRTNRCRLPAVHILRWS